MRWDLPLLPLISSRSTDDDTKEETFSISKRFLSSLVSSCLVANQLTQVQQRNHPQKDPPPPSEYPTTQLLHHPRAIRKRRTAVRRRRGLEQERKVDEIELEVGSRRPRSRRIRRRKGSRSRVGKELELGGLELGRERCLTMGRRAKRKKKSRTTRQVSQFPLSRLHYTSKIERC